MEMKKYLTRYFAKKAMNAANKVWVQNKWSEIDEQKFLAGN